MIVRYNKFVVQLDNITTIPNTCMLKRNPSLTEQAKLYIKQRIVNDEFEEGRIPSETTLANELGVSRTTIRDALSRLELEGAVYRKQGAGTFVNEAGLQIKTRLEEIWTYEDMLDAHGYSHAVEIISVEERPAPPRIAEALAIAPEAPILVAKKRFIADGRPVIITINHIPVNLIQTAWEQSDFSRPIYEFLAEKCRQHLAYYLSEIVPLVASPLLGPELGVTAGKTALLSFDEVGYNQENEPILCANSCFRDDMLRLRLIRRGAM